MKDERSVTVRVASSDLLVVAKMKLATRNLQLETVPSSFILSFIGKFWLWLFRWKICGESPTHRKFVLIAAPHTSNWDFPFMLATAFAMRVRISWFGKHTLFIPPWGWFMRRLGGIPVDRRSPHTLVMQMAENSRTARTLSWPSRRREPGAKHLFGSQASTISLVRVTYR